MRLFTQPPDECSAPYCRSACSCERCARRDAPLIRRSRTAPFVWSDRRSARSSSRGGGSGLAEPLPEPGTSSGAAWAASSQNALAASRTTDRSPLQTVSKLRRPRRGTGSLEANQAGGEARRLADHNPLAHPRIGVADRELRRACPVAGSCGRSRPARPSARRFAPARASAARPAGRSARAENTRTAAAARHARTARPRSRD